MRHEAAVSWNGWRLAAVVAAILAALVAILAIQTAASAHDHVIPRTILKKGAGELQPGTKVAESNWVHPADDGLCVSENAFYSWRFPETNRVTAGSTLKVRIFKSQRPDSFKITAYPRLDTDGVPAGESRTLDRSLERVVRDGKTVAWDVLFEVRRASRNYYLLSEGHWRDSEGCGGADQYASWGFHVETRPTT